MAPGEIFRVTEFESVVETELAPFSEAVCADFYPKLGPNWRSVAPMNTPIMAYSLNFTYENAIFGA